MGLRAYARALTGAAAVTALIMGGTAQAADDEELGLLAFLGLTQADGKTTTGADAGKLEASLLAASMVESAATKIRGAVGNITGEATVIPMTEGSAPMLRSLATARTRLKIMDDAIAAPANLKCAKKIDPKKPTGTKATGGDGDGNEAASTPSSSPKLDDSASGLLSALTGALKTDVSISGLTLTADETMLLNALMSEGGGKNITWKSLTDSYLGGDGSMTIKLATNTAMLNAELALCDKDKANRKAEVEAALALGKTLTDAGKDGAPSILEMASQLGPMIPEEGGPVYLLSIKTGTVGGSLITRSNIWTTLGLEKSVFVRGGLTASWRLINGRDGTVKAAGTVRCGSQATSFDAVHTAAAASNNCT